MLTADWVRPTSSAARVKLPVSTMAMKVRRRSMSRLGIIISLAYHKT